jgi:hypothetical protein
VKRGDRVVHGEVELVEKLGRNDPCPCGSSRSFQALLPDIGPLRWFAAGLLPPGVVGRPLESRGTSGRFCPLRRKWPVSHYRGDAVKCAGSGEGVAVIRHPDPHELSDNQRASTLAARWYDSEPSRLTKTASCRSAGLSEGPVASADPAVTQSGRARWLCEPRGDKLIGQLLEVVVVAPLDNLAVAVELQHPSQACPRLSPPACPAQVACRLA